MNRWHPLVLVAALLLLTPARHGSPSYASAAAAQAEHEEVGSPRTTTALTILQINDVYSTLPIEGRGGLARLATLKQRMKAEGHSPLLMIAGDFLSPSVASSVFKGEQMIEAFNAAGLDVATLGNHEFDFGTDLLIERMGQAKWQWVVSNVIDTNTGKPIGGAAPYVVRTFGSLKVGIIGLCLVTEEISRGKLTHVRLVNPLEAAATALHSLQQEKVDAIVALTHLSFADDRALAVRFPQIDVIVGGHEHYPLTATENRTLISKAGSDAKFVARIDLNRPKGGVLEKFYELIPITAAIPEDPRTAETVAMYESRLSDELNTVVGTTLVPLDANTIRLRGGETNMGDLIADALRTHVDADVAIVNAGTIRGDRVYPAGDLSRRTLIQIQPFGNVLCKVAVTGRVLLQALNSGVSKLPTTAAQFPQVSGVRFHVNLSAPANERVTQVEIGGQPLNPDKEYTVAISDFVLSGGDGYSMFPGQRVLIGPESGDLMVTAFEAYVAAQHTVQPSVDGRIVIDR